MTQLLLMKDTINLVELKCAGSADNRGGLESHRLQPHNTVHTTDSNISRLFQTVSENTIGNNIT